MKPKIAVLLLAVLLCLTTGCNNASHIAEMEPKTIVAIVLVAFIIGGFIFLQVRKKNRK